MSFTGNHPWANEIEDDFSDVGKVLISKQIATVERQYTNRSFDKHLIWERYIHDTILTLWDTDPKRGTR